MKDADAKPAPAWVAWAALAGVTLVGALFRLLHLDLAALRGDSLEFWRICGGNTTSGQIWSNWIGVMGNSGQFPFAMAFTKAFLEWFNLEPTFFSLRLPTVLWGVLTIPAAFGLGRTVAGLRGAIALGLMVALHPFHLQMTREAYYYAPLILGSFLMLRATLEALPLARREATHTVNRFFPYRAIAGFGLMVYSQPVGWLVALLLGGIVMGSLLISFRAARPGASRLLALVGGGFVVLGLPLLVYDWALPQMLRITSGPIRENSLAAFAVSTETFGHMLFKAATSFAWGKTLPRAVLTFLALGFGLAFWLRNLRARWELGLLPLVIIGGILGFLKARESAGAMFEARYIITVMPAYLVLLLLGLLYLGDLLARILRSAYAAHVMPVLGVAALLHPAWLCVQLTGHPTPYRELVAWCDAHLPPRAPVLVDRWFEPNNELVPYPATNVQFTFTLPNEPIQQFQQIRWRETAQAFWEKFPDAAYMEVAKSYWDVPSVGDWPWTRTFFRQHAAITNTAGLGLRNLGLAARGDFYWATTNRLVVDIFYNTREDVMARHAATGGTVAVWFGPGWGYTKTQDYRDWRVLQDRAELQLINLTPNPLAVRVALRCVAAGQAGKEIATSRGTQGTLPGGQLIEWDWGTLTLEPGLQSITLRDPRPSVPLLLDQVLLNPAG